jgi:hypothetical protein
MNPTTHESKILAHFTTLVRSGSNASVELSWHVGFTPDFGRMVATQELTLRARKRLMHCSKLAPVSW